MKWKILFFIILLIASSCNEPASKVDYTHNQPADSIAVWLNWVTDSTGLTTTAKKNLLQKTFDRTLALPRDSIKTNYLADISYANLILGDSIAFKNSNKTLLEEARITEDHYAHGIAHWNWADFYKGQQPDSAYYHYREAHKQFTQWEYDGRGEPDYAGRMLVAMADIKEDIKDYVGAEKDAVSALEIFKGFGDPKQLSAAYNILGGIQSGLNKFDEALEYYNKSSRLFDEVPEDVLFEYETRYQNNIASVYMRAENYEKAAKLYGELLEREDLFEQRPSLYALALGSFSYNTLKKGGTDYVQMLSQLERSTAILDSLGATFRLARNYQFAAEVLAKMGDTIKAVEQVNLAVSMAKSTLNNDRLLQAYELCTRLDKANAAQHAQAYYALNEELQMQERRIQDKFARIQLETDEVIEENQILLKRSSWMAGIIIGILVLGIGVFTIGSLRISNQKLKFKQKQQESNQEIYNLMLAQHGKIEEGKKSEQKRVSEELHDGILGQMLGIRLMLSGLNDRTDETAVAQREELIVKLQELEEEIRTISHELSAAAYEKVHNFIISVKELIKGVEHSSEIAIQFDHDEDFEWDRLNGDVKINSYRIVQELIQNAVKHAQCKTIAVSFTIHKNFLNLIVADDGIGFDSSQGKSGIGLKNITSRVKKLNAQLEINSSPASGTAVTIKIPNIDLLWQQPQQINLRNSVLEA